MTNLGTGQYGQQASLKAVKTLNSPAQESRGMLVGEKWGVTHRKEHKLQCRESLASLVKEASGVLGSKIQKSPVRASRIALNGKDCTAQAGIIPDGG